MENPSSESVLTTPMSNVSPAGQAYAGFWRRLAAYLIDSIILGAATGILNSMLVLNFNNPADNTASTLAVLLNIAIAWGYFALFESSSHQATPGKMALGLIVTTLNGGRISWRRALLRTIAKGIIGFLAIIIPFTERKQAVHDMIVKTVVLKKS